MTAAIAGLNPSARKYVSAVALAELEAGVCLHEAVRKLKLKEASEVLTRAKTYHALPITHHTSAEYAALKTKMATFLLKNALSKEKRRWIEDWLSVATGKNLQIDENDLWMCAQAREKNLVFITTDAKMFHVFSEADSGVRFMLLR